MEKIRSKTDKFIALCFIAIIFTFGVVTSGRVVYGLLHQEVEAGIEAVEDAYNEDVLGKTHLVSYNGGFHRLLGQRVVPDVVAANTLIKTADGSLTSAIGKYDVSALADNTENFKEYLAAKDISFLYIQAPYKVLEGYTELPVGIVDYSNANMDDFVGMLTENGVACLDLRQDILKENDDWEGLFFKTDHHWQTATAFWAFTKAAKVLEEDFGFAIDDEKLDIKQYNTDSFADCYLGAQGRRVGQLYAGLDDYDFISPKYATDLTVTINKTGGAEREQTGEFMQSIVYTPLLDMTAAPSTNHYASYFGGDYPEVIIKNNLNAGGEKVLLIKDSFSLPFAAFLSTTLGELRLIDLRYMKDRTVYDYVDSYQPDLVMILYNPSVLGAEEMFTFTD